MRYSDWTAALALALALATPAGAAHKPSAIERKAEADARQVVVAKALIIGGNAAAALPILDAVIAEYDAQAATEKRRIYSGGSLTETLAYMVEAANDHTSAVDLGPVYSQALFNKGFALVELGRVTEAGEYYERAARMAPHNPGYASEFAFWHGRMGEWNSALTLYRRALADNDFAPDSLKDHERAVAMRGEGYVLIELGRLDEAEAVFKDCLTHDPGDAKAQNELTYIRQQREKLARSGT